VCIVGGIKIGDGSYVGANTVVSRDLPANSAVLGIPMRSINLGDRRRWRAGGSW